MSPLRVAVRPADHVGGDKPDHARRVWGLPVSLLRAGYPIVKLIQQHYGKRMRFVFRNFPFTEIHPHAESAAEAAEFAGAPGKFWEMHECSMRTRCA